MFFTIKLNLNLNCILILNWIVWNRNIFIKMDLALNDQQSLICHKTQTTNQLRIFRLYPFGEEQEPIPKSGVLNMTISYMWWWGFLSGDLGSVKYLFTAITPRSTLTSSGSTSYHPIKEIFWKLLVFDKNTWNKKLYALNDDYKI